MAGLSDTGFTIQTVDEIIEEVSADLKARLDPNLDTTPTSVLGMLIGIMAERERKIQVMARDVYNAFTPVGSFGQSATQLALITGTKRADATYSEVEVTVNLDGLFTLPAGSRANVSGDTTAVFETVADIENPSGSPANRPGLARAVESGPVRANAGTLTVITTPTVGWNSITNALDATLGAPIESDQDLKERREQELRVSGSSNLDALIARMRQVDGIVDVVGRENDTDTDGDIEAHSFELVVWAGDPFGAEAEEVGQAIWVAKPTGIRPVGANTAPAIDAIGDEHTMRFTIAEEVPVYLEVDIEVDLDTFPLDGDDQIKSAIVDYATENWSIGAGVRPSKLYIPVLTEEQADGTVIPRAGVDAIIEIRTSLDDVTYTEADLAMEFGQKPLADTSRITINHV